MPSETTSRTSLYRWIIILGAVLIAGIGLIRFFGQGAVAPASELRRFTIVPPFALTERNGKTITNADLNGKIWVADFVYTTCPGPCPMITATMEKIQDAVAHDPRVQLVTFTVDPETDTPAVLAAYAAKFNADPNRWWFLTGPEKPLYDLIQNGFFQVAQDNHGQALQDGQGPVTHSTKIVLVDAEGNVRGFFDGVGSDGRADLLKGIKTLEKESL
jgi:protein SCO1/2